MYLLTPEKQNIGGDHAGTSQHNSLNAVTVS